MYLSASAVAGKPDRGTITSVRPLPFLPLQQHLYAACRFRLLAKSLAAFLSAQMPSDASLRLSADAAGALNAQSASASASQQARHALSHLQSLRTNNNYAPLRRTLEQAIELVTSPQMSLREANVFLSQLVNALFPDVSYLEIVRRPSLWTA